MNTVMWLASWLRRQHDYEHYARPIHRGVCGELSQSHKSMSLLVSLFA